MNKINCIIADDEELARNVVKSHASRLRQINVAAICSNGVEVTGGTDKKPHAR